MKIRLNRTIKLVILSITVLALCTTVAFALNNIVNNSTVAQTTVDTIITSPIPSAAEEKVKKKIEEKQDDVLADTYAKAYGKNKQDVVKLKSELGDWKDVFTKLQEEKDNSKRLPDSKVLELYDQGYGIQDIEKAEYLAAQCDKTPEEVLAIKGKTTDYNRKMAKMADKNSILDDEDKKNTSKSWDEVEKTLGVKGKKSIDQLLPKSDIDEMKNQGLSEKQICDIVSLASNYKKDYKDVLKEVVGVQ